MDLPVIDADMIDTPEVASEVVDAPVSAELALATLRGTSLAELTAVERGIAKLKADHGATDYDIKTPKGYKLATARRLAVREVRYKVPHVVKARKAELKEIAEAVGTEGDRIIALLREIEDPHDDAIKAEDQRKADEAAAKAAAEAERKAKHESGIAKIRGYIGLANGLPAARIQLGIDALAAMVFGDSWEEFQSAATAARDETVAALKVMHAAAAAREAEAARIEAQRLENERIAAEQARVAAEQKAETDRLAAIAAELQRKADELAAQQAAEAQRKADESAAFRAEQDRIFDEAAARFQAGQSAETARMSAASLPNWLAANAVPAPDILDNGLTEEETAASASCSEPLSAERIAEFNRKFAASQDAMLAEYRRNSELPAEERRAALRECIERTSGEGWPTDIDQAAVRQFAFGALPPSPDIIGRTAEELAPQEHATSVDVAPYSGAVQMVDAGIDAIDTQQLMGDCAALLIELQPVMNAIHFTKACALIALLRKATEA